LEKQVSETKAIIKNRKTCRANRRSHRGFFIALNELPWVDFSGRMILHKFEEFEDVKDDKPLHRRLMTGMAVFPAGSYERKTLNSVIRLTLACRARPASGFVPHTIIDPDPKMMSFPAFPPRDVPN
jgi:hypothetical protein